LHAVCDTILARIFRSRNTLFRKDNVPRDLQVLHHYLSRPVVFDTKTGVHRIVIDGAKAVPDIDVAERQRYDIILVLQAVLFNPNTITLQWKVASVRPAKIATKKSIGYDSDLPDADDVSQKYARVMGDIAQARSLIRESTAALDAIDTDSQPVCDATKLHAALVAMEFCRSHAASIVRMC
jgi:hypothetical protein